jgi:hypothetical protein
MKVTGGNNLPIPNLGYTEVGITISDIVTVPNVGVLVVEIPKMILVETERVVS